MPVSRTVATIAIAGRRPTVGISIRPPGRGGDRVLGVHHHVQKDLMEQQRIALHPRQLLVIVSHDFDADGTVCGRSQRQHLLEHDVQADRAAREPARPGEHQQVAHDLGGPVPLRGR
jgi:hypothetical protein